MCNTETARQGEPCLCHTTLPQRSPGSPNAVRVRCNIACMPTTANLSCHIYTRPLKPRIGSDRIRSDPARSGGHLQVRLVLDQLLSAAVQQADVGVCGTGGPRWRRCGAVRVRAWVGGGRGTVTALSARPGRNCPRPVPVTPAECPNAPRCLDPSPQYRGGCCLEGEYKLTLTRAPGQCRL